MKENKSLECSKNILEVNSNIQCENNFENEKCQPPDPCDNNNHSLTVEKYCNETFKKPLLPFCHYKQSNNFLLINIKCEIHKISSFHIEIIDSKTFKFQYKYLDNGFVPVSYGCSVCTAPYTFKTKGLFHDFSNDSLIIKVQKKKTVFWTKIKMGVEQRKMKELILKGTKIKENDITSQGNELSSVEPHSGNQVENQVVNSSLQNGTESLENLTVSNNQNLIKQSTGELDEIPKFVQRMNGYFLTRSWPQGILKVRSHSLRESTMEFQSHSPLATEAYSSIFHSSLNCKEDIEGEIGEENEVESSITKKSVRFNDLVCQKVFRVDGSILGQKAKNQKKALQRKRAKERKLSKEESQSSGTSICTDHTDLSTTQEDSSTEVEVIKQKEVSKPKKKKRSNKKPSLNISNQMLIQLDDI